MLFCAPRLFLLSSFTVARIVVRPNEQVQKIVYQEVEKEVVREVGVLAISFKLASPLCRVWS